MHYYKRNLGDYYKKAGRLTMLQHGACTLLIDSCYDREEFPTLDMALDWCWASDDAEVAAVKFVLSKLFREEDGVFIQDQIKNDIDKYHQNAETNKRIALEREAKRRDNSTNRVPSVNEPSPNQKPRTNKPNNQEPNNISEQVQDKFTNDDYEFSKWFFDQVKNINPSQKSPNFKKWADDVRLIRERDKKTHLEMSVLMAWANSDNFWCSNILSPRKLREHWDKLTIQMNSKSKNNHPQHMSNATKQTVNNLMNVEFD